MKIRLAGLCAVWFALLFPVRAGEEPVPDPVPLVEARRPPVAWAGPEIEFVSSNTVLDVVQAVREALKNDREGTFAFKVEATDEALAKIQARITLRRVPAAIALYYAADAARLKFGRRNGIWTMAPLTELWCGPFTVVERVEEKELLAMALKVTEKEEVLLSDGTKWLKEEEESISFSKGEVMICASENEIAIFRALLTLHRSGYKIPAINSAKERP